MFLRGLSHSIQLPLIDICWRFLLAHLVQNQAVEF